MTTLSRIKSAKEWWNVERNSIMTGFGLNGELLTYPPNELAYDFDYRTGKCLGIKFDDPTENLHVNYKDASQGVGTYGGIAYSYSLVPWLDSMISFAENVGRGSNYYYWRNGQNIGVNQSEPGTYTLTWLFHIPKGIDDGEEFGYQYGSQAERWVTFRYGGNGQPLQTIRQIAEELYIVQAEVNYPGDQNSYTGFIQYSDYTPRPFSVCLLQVEKGQGTSFVPSSENDTEVRDVQVVKKEIDSTWFNQNKGTFHIELSSPLHCFPEAKLNSARTVLNLHNGTDSAYVKIERTTLGQATVFIKHPNQNLQSTVFNIPSGEASIKFYYSNDKIHFNINQQSYDFDWQALSTSEEFSILHLGCDNDNGDNNFIGYISKFNYFPSIQTELVDSPISEVVFDYNKLFDCNDDTINGLFVDGSNITNMYQDVNGRIPVEIPGDPVGLVIDSQCGDKRGFINRLLQSSNLSADPWIVQGNALIETDGDVRLGPSSSDYLYQAVGPNRTRLQTERYSLSFFINPYTHTGEVKVQTTSNGQSIVNARGLWTIDLSLIPPGGERIDDTHPSVTVVEPFTSSDNFRIGVLFRVTDQVARTVKITDVQLEEGSVSTNYQKNGETLGGPGRHLYQTDPILKPTFEGDHLFFDGTQELKLTSFDSNVRYNIFLRSDLDDAEGSLFGSDQEYAFLWNSSTGSPITLAASIGRVYVDDRQFNTRLLRDNLQLQLQTNSATIWTMEGCIFDNSWDQEISLGRYASTFLTGKIYKLLITNKNLSKEVISDVQKSLIRERGNVDRTSDYYSHDQVEDLFYNKTGGWYDPSDPVTMFKDHLGIEPVSQGGKVGLFLDKSQGLRKGPNIWKPITRTQNAAGWYTINQDLILENDGSGMGFIADDGPQMIIDDWYIWEFDVLEITSGSIRPGGSYQTMARSVDSVGRYRQIMPAKQTKKHFYANNFTGKIGNISIRKLYGNHAYQTVDSKKPIYNNYKGYHFLDTTKSDCEMIIPKGFSYSEFTVVASSFCQDNYLGPLLNNSGDWSLYHGAPQYLSLDFQQQEYYTDNEKFYRVKINDQYADPVSFVDKKNVFVFTYRNDEITQMLNGVVKDNATNIDRAVEDTECLMFTNSQDYFKGYFFGALIINKKLNEGQQQALSARIGKNGGVETYYPSTPMMSLDFINQVYYAGNT